jgi:hypothetical protein
MIWVKSNVGWMLGHGNEWLAYIEYYPKGGYISSCSVSGRCVFSVDLDEAKRWCELESLHATALKICEGEL